MFKERRKDLIRTDGTITSVHGLLFKVKLANGGEVLAKPNGKFGKFLITLGSKRRKGFLLVGDPVGLELSPYDLTRGFIAFRGRWTEGLAN